MGVIEFLEYLHDHAATSDLAERLTQVFAIRGRMELVPVEISRPGQQRVAS